MQPAKQQIIEIKLKIKENKKQIKLLKQDNRAIARELKKAVKEQLKKELLEQLRKNAEYLGIKVTEKNTLRTL